MVIGLIVLAVGGTILLNVTTSGPPKVLEDALAASPSSPGPAPTATVVIAPSTSPATPGVAYPIALMGKCRVPGAIDFDAVDPATIALQGESSALVRTAAGQTVALVRSAAERVAAPAC